VLYFSYLQEEKRQAAWQRFAAQNHLTFIPGNFITGGTQVTGKYRDHYIELNTHNEGKVSFTRLSLYARHFSMEEQPTRQAEIDKPSVSDINDRLTPTRPPYYLSGRIETARGGHEIVYKERGIIKDPIQLKRLADLLSDIIQGYPAVASLGGVAVPALHEIASNGYPLQMVAITLLEDIAEYTRSQLSYRLPNLLCPTCLTKFGPHEIHLNWWRTITYYGCRTCGQSREFIEDNGQAVMILNQAMTTTQLRQDGIFLVNWLAQRELFDFDEVQIIQASDEEVERFAVQVGNDTDPLREARYQQMRCIVSPRCRLSENTMRILERMFGQVEVGETR
jgi:hypothetical protein